MLCLFRSSSVAVEPARVEEVSESQVGGETSTFDTQSGQPVETSREATPTPTPDETKQVEQPDTWEESFKGHMDSRPYGEGVVPLFCTWCVLSMLVWGQKMHIKLLLDSGSFK